MHEFKFVVQIGGVVMQSPFIAIAAYEKKLGIPANYLNCSMYVHLHIQLGGSTPTVLQHRAWSQWRVAEIRTWRNRFIFIL
jgi:hypothetical protein